MAQRLLALIADKGTDEPKLREAIQKLGDATEPAGFWVDIANDDSYRRVHRRYAAYQLFRRHVHPGMTLGELARMLHDPQWLTEEDITVVEDLGGYIPVKLTADNTVFVLRLLPEPPPADEFWAIFLSVSGEIDRDSFVQLLHRKHVDRRVAEAKILEVGFHPPDLKMIEQQK